MAIFETIVGAVSGSFGEILDTVRDYFPPEMSAEDKAKLELQLTNATREHEIKMLNLAYKEDKEFNDRIRDLEGTAKDLKSIPILGAFILFLRGCLRPLFAGFTFWLDYQVFSGAWQLDGVLENAFFAVNMLVLGFLFGERAVKNVMPYFARMMINRSKKETNDDK